MTCKVCGWWEKVCKCQEEQFDIYTTKDKLYEFVDINTTGKPLEFRTKGQWNKHLKKLGMHDDCKQSARGRDEIMRSVEERGRFKPTPREEMKKEILKVYDQIRRNR